MQGLRVTSTSELLLETDPSVYDRLTNWPRISIVTPSFNQGRYIEQTIRSILLQNYPNLEYIIIDGGSTDETLSILKKYDTNITYWESKSDNGQSHAINKGLQKATGAIFNWINSDDVLLPGALAKVALAYVRQPLCNTWCFSTFYYDGNNIGEVNGANILSNTLYETLIRPSINQLGTFWNLESVLSLGGVREDLHYAMDVDLWLRYLLLHSGELKKIHMDKDHIGLFRLHEKSKTKIESRKKRFSEFDKEKFLIYKTFSSRHFFSQNAHVLEASKLDSKDIMRLYNSYCISSMSRAFHKNDFARVLDYFIRLRLFDLNLQELRDAFYLVRKSVFQR